MNFPLTEYFGELNPKSMVPLAPISMLEDPLKLMMRGIPTPVGNVWAESIINVSPW